MCFEAIVVLECTNTNSWCGDSDDLAVELGKFVANQKLMVIDIHIKLFK